MKKAAIKKVLQKAVRVILPLVLTFGIGFGSGYAFLRHRQAENAELVERNTEGLDLRFPSEMEKRIVTKDEIAAKLVEISQLATYSEEYTVSKSVDQTRFFLDDIPLPGTTNTISLECDGIVKVGYEVSAITPTVDNDSQKIYIALPSPTVLDNYLIWDSVRSTESNNILNPIKFEQYQKLIGEIEQEGLEKAEEMGIYEAAEDNVKLVIRNFLSEFEGYQIVFM